MRIIFHLDMDAFYASVEQRDRPEWRGRPVIVGAPPSRRGVVCAASYEARKFGVRSAMPSVTAGRLCPKGIFVEPRMGVYRAESEMIMKIVAATGAIIEPVSIDEAYLDLSGQMEGGWGDGDAALQMAVPMARQLKEQIWRERNLRTSIGIAGNKLLAKIASDFGKPNGLILIPERDKALFLRPQPVRVIHGIGRVTEEHLREAGIMTVGDLQDYAGDLRSLVGSFGATLKRYAFGEDDRPLDLSSEAKSISSETTFLQNTDDRRILRRSLQEQSAEIAAKLGDATARTVQVKVRYGNFKTVTRQMTVEDGVASEAEIYRLSCFLLGRDKLVSGPLRLIGISVGGLAERARQLRLPLGQKT